MVVDTSPSQYDKTIVMHFSFSLLRIKGLYMCPALLALPLFQFTAIIAIVAQPTDYMHEMHQLLFV
jgi:hypothetical protein